ncbi:dynamin family protein [Prevotella copri]|jgi:GTPase Era involved in 16S rRNA processing|uniref:Dynamin family protein n=1 Tax=Segatella copri TaxID=165179 RepID=A0A3R6FB20_9BACT|nr:dynamin family protein [Segatella copri]MCP9552448.1 dynamin family protein [Segatella copri]MCP9574537.1 dynamin family protein [Segatella copri]MCP9576279.1 dynamin family protein [Segatella copri]MCP9579136.1 dynamin family protein [Segatella copri]MCP9582120.1 dynamin family protein [Segatella copri]
MEHIEFLKEVAQELGQQNILNSLNAIQERASQQNANLLIPLVGEFSSGKTTLLNALTDSKKLETATKPTTATIYEIHFGCNKCEANVVLSDGQVAHFDDLGELKNDQLSDAQIVTVFDTSTKVPSSTILVDTPGLSSPVVKHRQVLVDFLPSADAILLVVDINQQVTRSLTDFIDMIKLSKRPVYIVLTKSDTKSVSEIEAAKQYIADNCKLPVQQVVVVSAAKDNISELYALLETIQKSKNEILAKVDGQRIKDLAQILVNRVDEMLTASSSDENLDMEIRRQQLDLDKIKRNINRLIDSMASDISEDGSKISRRFEDSMYEKLGALVAGGSANMDNDALSVINNTASLLLSEYKNNIMGILKSKVQSAQGSESEIPVESLMSIDLSEIQISGLNYNLDLNSMGHEYDGIIKTGVIAVAAVATVAAAVATAGAAGAAAGAAGTAGTAGAAAGTAGTAGAAGTVATTVAASKAVDIIDTATDVGSIIYTRKMMKRIAKTEEFAGKAVDKYNKIEKADEKGILSSMVGFATERLLSKPQRVRAVRNYVDGTLAPEFKSQMENLSQSVVNMVRGGLQNDASEMIAQKTAMLNELKEQCSEHKAEFARRKETLKQYKEKLSTI